MAELNYSTAFHYLFNEKCELLEMYLTEYCNYRINGVVYLVKTN